MTLAHRPVFTWVYRTTIEFDVSVGVAAVPAAGSAQPMIRRFCISGSRGLYWLEPMIVVATAQGRVAFGPVTDADVPSVLDAMVADGPHALRLGITDEIPSLKRQTRLTFALRRGRSALG